MSSTASILLRHRISVDEFDRMVLAGVFRTSGRLELLNGEILEMTPIGSDHASRVDCLHELFVTRLQGRAHVRSQGPIHMGGYSEPQPDLMLLKPREDRFRDRHPGPEDVWLVIEVASTSLAFDREVKAPLYRGEAILEYWIINLIDQVVEVHRRDEPRTVRTFHRGESIAPIAFPDDLEGVRSFHAAF